MEKILPPHLGETTDSFFGDGMGVLIPFNPNQTKPSPTPSGSTDPNAEPMQAASDQYESQIAELSTAADKRAAQRLKGSTTPDSSDKS